MPLPNFGEIAEQLRRSTVVVYAGSRGNGSGVIWSSDGLIVTNAHVARSSRLKVQLWDGREFDAAVNARDSGRDLASLKIAARDLPAATPADSSRLRPGELAIAIGNPLGFVGALTTGMIQAVGPIRNGGVPQHWIQSDVRLAPGNSGGPLADAHGRVIGINTMVAGRLALAIPINTVRDFVAGSGDAWLGISVYPVQVPHYGGKRFGLVLLEVQPGSPAAHASLLPGDILLGAQDQPFQLLDDLQRALQGRGPRLLRLQFLRGDYHRVRRVTVQLGAPVGGSVAA